MDSLNAYLWLAIALFAWVVMWYAIAMVKKRNDVADVAWGLGFVWLAWLAFYHGGGNDRAWVVNVLISIWGLRLAWHIHTRNQGKPEDFRYAQWRKEWKHFYLRSFFQVFLLQGFFLYVIAWPVLFINLTVPTPRGWLDYAGIVIWLVGFSFEAIGDYQLKLFKKNPANRGKIITTGLWRYTRHPNYFGDAMQWWGVFTMACALPSGWMMLVSPVLMTYLLRYVSGVPMLERKYEDHAEFEAYKRKTSVFFPLPPKR